MAAVIEKSTGIHVTVTSTSSELNVNKKADTGVIDNSGENENKMTTKQHHHNEGECK